MTIEDIIKANTAALIENTAALREILSVGASTAAVQAVPEPVKKSRAKAPPLTAVEPGPTPAQAEAREKIQELLDQDPPITADDLAQAAQECAEEQASSERLIADTETPAAPDLPPTELRAKLKEEIKLRIMGDPAFKNHFESCREKYGIALVKDLTDDQLPGFYAEVLA